jgi:hypothetical protein
MSGLEPTPEQFASLAARPADAPVVMVNLLKFRPEGARSATGNTDARSLRTSNASALPSATRGERLRW